MATNSNLSGTSSNLFAGLRYHIASCIFPEDQDHLRVLLEKNGAIEATSIKQAQYVFTDSEGFEHANEVSSDAVLVRPEWVARSISNKSRQEPKFFSPSPRAIFSTLVIATDQLPPGDVEAVVAALHLRGGMYREGLTRDVTHLLVLGPTGDKYLTAKKYASQTGIKIVLIHWFDDCCKLGQRLSEEPYERSLLEVEEKIKRGEYGTTGGEGNTSAKRLKPRLSSKTKMMYQAMMRAQTPPRGSSGAGPASSSQPKILPISSPSKIPATSSSPTKPSASSPLKFRVKDYANSPPLPHDVWQGRRVLLSHSLMLSSDRRSMVEYEVQRYGGVIVRPTPPSSKMPVETSVAGEAGEEEDDLDHDSEVDEQMQFDIEFAERQWKKNPDELRISDKYIRKDAQEALLVMRGETDVFVTKYRSGLGYLAALSRANERERDIPVGTLPWLFYCHATGSIAPPSAQLLHFPVRRGCVDGIRGKQITISNYQGHARDYLKKLINVMAGPLPPKTPEVFTATLCKNTNIVIAGRMEGQKVEKAQSWNLCIVNHLWLEDSYREWRFASLTRPEYTHYRDQISYTDILPGCSVYKRSRDDKDGEMPFSTFFKHELKILSKEMTSIGYQPEYIEDICAGRQSSIRQLVEAVTIASSSIQDEQEPSTSLVQVEKELMRDEDVYMESVEEPPEASYSPLTSPTSLKTNNVVMQRESARSKDHLSSMASPITKKGRGAQQGGSTEPLFNSQEYRKEVENVVRGGFDANADLNRTISGRTSAHLNLLRSPWDPSPKKGSRPPVTNDTPPQSQEAIPRKMLERGPRHRTPDVRTPVRSRRDLGKSDDDEDSGSPLDVQERIQTRSDRKMTKSTIQRPSRKENSRNVEITRSLSPAEAQMQDQNPPSSPSSSVHGERAATPHPIPSSTKRAKRDIHTQDSDEEFEIESPGNLLTRRTKVSGTRPAHESPERNTTDAKRGKRTELNQGGDESDEDDWADKGKPVSARADKAMRRLRDSISGKEDNRPNTGKKVPTEDEDVDMQPRTRGSIRRKSARSDVEGNTEDDSSEALEPEFERRTRTTRDKKGDGQASLSTKGHRRHTSDPSTDGHGKREESHARRSAAAKATQVLHDKIMPDANRFASEFKSGNIRGDWEEKKRKRDENDDDDRKRRRKVVGEVGEVGVKRTASSSKHATAPLKTGIRMITTKVPLNNQQYDKLRRMGIQPVDDPKTCTHLVSNSILRTEKFLCAIAAGPTIVTAKWVKDCLAKGKVVDDSDYRLVDTEGEKRLNVNLEETLERARKNGRRLFGGHTFYLSPNLSDFVSDTLKNVIEAAGGKCLQQSPNPRQLENNQDQKHFIGADGDRKKFKTLVERSIPIYSQEVVLAAVLKQKMPDWEAQETRLP